MADKRPPGEYRGGLMDEQFDERALLDSDTLHALLRRRTVPSVTRLALHYVAFILIISALIANTGAPVTSFLLALALAWVWACIFAPFHECTHRSAFITRRGNALGAWLTALPYMMSPSVYRAFHFEHHRHTQNPDKDPELMDDPRYAHWPTGWRNWLLTASGIGLIRSKVTPLIGFSFKPSSRWNEFAGWSHKIDNQAGLVLECRIMLAAWTIFAIACLTTIPNGGYLLFAAWFAHVFQTLWFSAEHTGLPTDGAMVECTRSVTSNGFVRFWLWNMNYHAEHHTWPGMPWHQLPAAHRLIKHQLPSLMPGYQALHQNVIHARNLPTCDNPPTVA